MSLSNLKYTLDLHVGKLGEASVKHRSAVLMLSVLMLFISPSVKVTFGSASVAGLGISIDPPQTIFLGIFLFALLIYRLAAFWAAVLLESGTDSSRATRKAQLEFEPSLGEEQNRAHDMGALIQSESRKTVYKWSVRQILWEFVFPNILAAIALTKYLLEYFLDWFV